MVPRCLGRFGTLGGPRAFWVLFMCLFSGGVVSGALVVVTSCWFVFGGVCFVVLGLLARRVVLFLVGWGWLVGSAEGTRGRQAVGFWPELKETMCCLRGARGKTVLLALGKGKSVLPESGAGSSPFER